MVKLSVVMSVYNGASALDATLDSILAQTERDFELLVVDDGSTDATPSLLAARNDPRLRVITQPNAGLTRALIRGCAEAQGTFIARHDAGDRSHPDRFRQQLELFEAAQSGASVQSGAAQCGTADSAVRSAGVGGATPGSATWPLVLVSCATTYVGPRDERLYVARADGAEVRASLMRDGVDAIRGLTHHGSAMFRRDAYLAAGGYREAFHFAQDLDLWVRLARLGTIAFADGELYEARVDVDAISSTNRPEQLALARIALAIRDHPEREPELLAEAAAIGPRKRARTRRERAMAHYFIASCLRRARDGRWRGYALKAVLALLMRPR